MSYLSRENFSMKEKEIFSLRSLFLLLFLTVPQYLFTYLFLWVTLNRVVSISELNFKQHGQIFLPPTIFVVNQTYLFFKKDSLANYEKMFEYAWDFGKKFAGFAGIIILFAVIGSVFKSLSNFLGNVVQNFLPNFYADLLYVAFVIIPLLVFKTPVPEKK